MTASQVVWFILVAAAFFVALASLQANAEASGLHEETGAFKKGKIPWWWDTDYTRSKRRRPIHN
uniref:Uncharacterized protein n=1 Tax=Leersia perrieri TaxID=77586 RepID=A0A0D9XYI7_9ORYZ